ncbi:hypothetical protein [Thalassoglobus sp.]|uniref:hypothetical protein n=1 Tax=Thalassoglobus sp. TaxID=2795869 RepID=UPI003AA96A60
MSDYQTAANAAIDHLAENAGGIVEEYTTEDGRSVRRGKASEQIDAALKLEGIANRRRNGLFRVAKMQEPK